MNIGEEPTKKCECGEAFYFSENLAAHRDYCQKGIDAEKIRVLELQLGDKDEELSIRARMIQEYQLQVDALVKALREIAQMGSVCKDFENCSHPPCQDSCGAVLVALEALTPHPAPPCPPAPPAPVAEKRVEEPRCSMCWSNDGGRAWIHIGVPVRACGHDCHNKDAVKRKCPSTYSHSTHGKLTCEKDADHLNRIGDVEHYSHNVKWMSL